MTKCLYLCYNQGMSKENTNSRQDISSSPLSRAFDVAQMPGASLDLTQPDAVRVVVNDPGRKAAKAIMEGAADVHAATDDEGILGVQSGVVGIEGETPDEVVHLHTMGDKVIRIAVDVPNHPAEDQRAA